MYRSNVLEPPSHPAPGVNSIYLAEASNATSVGYVRKSSASPGVCFADKLKNAYDKQRQERKDVVTQNWTKRQSSLSRTNSKHYLNPSPY